MEMVKELGSKENGGVNFTSMHWGWAFFLSLLTLGLFDIYWIWRNSTSVEALNKRGKDYTFVLILVGIGALIFITLLNSYAKVFSRIMYYDNMYYGYRVGVPVTFKYLIMLFFYFSSYFIVNVFKVYMFFEVRDGIRAFLRRNYGRKFAYGFMGNLFGMILTPLLYLQREINRAMMRQVLNPDVLNVDYVVRDQEDYVSPMMKSDKPVFKRAYVVFMILIAIFFEVLAYIIATGLVMSFIPYDPIYGFSHGRFFILSIIRFAFISTLMVYVIYWISSRNRSFGALSPDMGISVGKCLLFGFFDISISAFFAYLQWPVSMIPAVFLYYVIFSYRDAMIDYVWTSFGERELINCEISAGFLDFFSIFYLQYKINALGERGVWETEA